MLEFLTRADAEGLNGTGRLRVAVRARDPVRVAALSALVAATGHAVAAEDQADLLLADATTDSALPSLVLSDDVHDPTISSLPTAIRVPALDAAMRAVAAGLIVRARALPDGFEPARPLLTPRELEILSCLGDGQSNKAVARRLGISQHTVKFHLEAVFAKLGANSRAEAVAKGLRSGLLEI
jgi:two-component system nitrate/nitrite response regulator NarL